MKSHADFFENFQILKISKANLSPLLRLFLFAAKNIDLQANCPSCASTLRKKMSHYEIYVTCTECNAEHPMGVRIDLSDGPRYKQSIIDAYYDKPHPPQLQAIEGHKVLCLKTGRTFIQSNLDDVFLVPNSVI